MNHGLEEINEQVEIALGLFSMKIHQNDKRLGHIAKQEHIRQTGNKDKIW